MAQINERQRDLLNEYLVEKRPLIEANNPTAAEVAVWVQENLRMHVDLGQITSRVGPKGKLYPHEWPGSEGGRKGRMSDRVRHNLIIQQIDLLRLDMLRFAAALGEHGYGRQVPEWPEVLNQLKSDLSTPTGEDACV